MTPTIVMQQNDPGALHGLKVSLRILTLWWNPLIPTTAHMDVNNLHWLQMWPYATTNGSVCEDVCVKLWGPPFLLIVSEMLLHLDWEIDPNWLDMDWANTHKLTWLNANKQPTRECKWTTSRAQTEDVHRSGEGWSLKVKVPKVPLAWVRSGLWPGRLAV